MMGQRRVRLAMYLAFVVLAVALVLQGLSTLRLEELRAADAEILDHAGLQRTLSQQAGRLAALLVDAADDAPVRARHLQALQVLVNGSAQDALLMEALLARQMARSTELQQRVGPALQDWQAARERLWYRSQILLRQADGETGALLRPSAAALQAETEPALAAAQRLSARLREAAEERAQRFGQEVRWGLAGMLVLLGLLGLAVVEPTARSVRRHGLRLREQATELQRLALVAEHTTALVLITDAEDLIVWVNAAFTRGTGWPLADAQGQRPGDLLAHAQADAAVHARLRLAVQEAQGLRVESLYRTRDGRDLWLDVDLRPLRDETAAAPGAAPPSPAEGAGRLRGFVRVCSDTTARVQQQAKLTALWAALPAGVTVLGPEAQILDANREAERMLGLSLAQMQGVAAMDARWRCLRADGSDYPPGELPAARTLATGQALSNETMGVHTPSGELRWLLVNTQPQRDNLGQVSGVVACFSDITQGRELQEQLHTSARTDALTRLPNRAVVMERLQQAVAHARRHAGYGFAVLFMDFDRFKQVNDTLGHGAGDELLRQMAQRLTLALRPGDAVARLECPMAARLGGDEFVVVLDGVGDVARAGHIAQRLLEELGEPYLIDNAPVQGSVSLGLVVCDDPQRLGADDITDAAAAEEVLRNADTAMYEAKRAGRGRWVLFDPAMHERVVRLLEVEADLRRALKEAELFVVYQPVVRLSDRQMSGVEALVRWQHPQRGLVPPVEFVPIAEECGLIDAVGAFVLETACRQFAQWQRRLGDAAPGQLAVNLSRAQLKRAALVDEVRDVLQANQMLPTQLQLEVTESLAAQDERVQTTLRELKALGVRLALDDFGTGYSSLACLHQMPVDTVKVDRSFVQHAETVEYHRVLIEATIRVARTMGMNTVAEGIETEGQALLMHALTCDAGQGYLFSRPLPADELERWALARMPQALDTV
ncbi:MAG: EAL domain-containing protein [Rubrivivax sp.]|nr:EAL domain-containing protein [Rubrivivax sp.]